LAARPEEHDYAPWRAEWRGGLATDVTGRGHALRVDEPQEFGGADTGPMPTELLAAALASCMCIAVAWAAGKRRVELPDLAVEVRPHRAPGEPRHGRYEVRVESSAPAALLDPCVALGARYCWVTNTLITPPEITYEVVGGG
jgi:putative redox protein